VPKHRAEEARRALPQPTLTVPSYRPAFRLRSAGRRALPLACVVPDPVGRAVISTTMGNTTARSPPTPNAVTETGRTPLPPGALFDRRDPLGTW